VVVVGGVVSVGAGVVVEGGGVDGLGVAAGVVEVTGVATGAAEEAGALVVALAKFVAGALVAAAVGVGVVVVLGFGLAVGWALQDAINKAMITSASRENQTLRGIFNILILLFGQQSFYTNLKLQLNDIFGTGR
jgi:hypothetical protein